MARFTLLLTQRCNLHCGYCYIEKRQASMSTQVAARIIDFIFARTSRSETIDIGFFGGEPLLELALLRTVTGLIKSHPSYPNHCVVLSVTTNGTLFSDEIAEFLNAEGIQVCISCDGPPAVQNRFRTFPDGQPSSAIVEQTLRLAARRLPAVRVNAVLRPETFLALPQIVSYFADLGVDQIYLNPDFSAPWSDADLAELGDVYARVGELYKQWHEAGTPRFISLIDSKIAIILGGGYRPEDRCRMGTAQLAFSPDGHLFPCERLVGDGGMSRHCIGTIDAGIEGCEKCRTGFATLSTDPQCQTCGLRDYCMRWCGCSNYMASGRYDRVSRFLCASEQAAIRVAFSVFATLSESLGTQFLQNLVAWQHDFGPATSNHVSNEGSTAPRLDSFR
jgi:uncharacterized protein